MKKLLLVFIICIFAISCSACASDSYRCEIINSFENLSEDSGSVKKTVIEIGNTSYGVEYVSSAVSELNNEIYDIYMVLDIKTE